MIINLPKTFPLHALEDFSFGDAEAKLDELLENPICFCKINGINEFLKGKKSIVVGERGSGKTALFRLVTNNKLNFKREKNEKHIIIPIEEELKYKSVKNQIISKILSYVKEDAVKYRIVWELFIMHHILADLSKEYPAIMPDSLAKAINDYESIFEVSSKKLSLFELWRAHKVTFGVKFDGLQGGVVTGPNFYSSLEPANAAPASDSKEGNVITFHFDALKRDIQSFLDKMNASVYILIDKLDEFVIKEDYEIQKMMIQGLLSCERDYQNYSHVKLKIFIRNDLFQKIDFEELGYEKVISRKIDLIWNSSDIREFIARRIVFNIIKHMKLSYLAFSVEEEQLYIDEKSSDFTDIDDNVSLGDGVISRMISRTYGKLSNIIPGVLCKATSKKSNGRDKREARHVNFNDERNRQVITSIFPRKIKHKLSSGAVEEIEIFNYIETHFALNCGYTTPRIIIMFLEECMDHVREYYRGNPDITVELDDSNEFPLVKRDLITDAYNDVRNDISIAFGKIDSKWESWYDLFRTRKGAKYTFTYKDMQKIIKTKSESELHRFLAFLSHIGYLQCVNPNANYPARSYKLPILFR